MKKYLIELIIIMIQLLIFYLLPLFSGPTDTMGLIVIDIIVLFIMSVLLFIITKNKYQLLYIPIMCGLMIPAFIIYSNEYAWLHLIWYIVDFAIALLIGKGIKYILKIK